MYVYFRWHICISAMYIGAVGRDLLLPGVRTDDVQGLLSASGSVSELPRRFQVQEAQEEQGGREAGGGNAASEHALTV